jgi:RNA polymerase primary sigma factor
LAKLGLAQVLGITFMASSLNFELREEGEGSSFERHDHAAEVLETNDSCEASLGKPDRSPHIAAHSKATASSSPDQEMAEESKQAEEEIFSRDLIDTYFRHMGHDPWLSREEEAALARRIETGERVILNRLFQVPMSAAQLRRWGADLHHGNVRLRDLIGLSFWDDESSFRTSETEAATAAIAGEAASPGDGQDREEMEPAGSPDYAPGHRLVEREARLMPGVLARIERISALVAEAASLSCVRAAALGCGEDLGRDDRARLDEIDARLDQEIESLNLHPDRISDLTTALENEQRALHETERALRQLAAGDHGRSQRCHDAVRVAGLETKIVAATERLGMPAAALRGLLAEIRHARRDVSGSREELVRSQLRLVVAIAKKYRRRSSLDFLDLIQEGNLGLMRAVEKFDHRHGVKLSTYAAWWVRQSIERAIMNQGRTIRIPVHMMETAARVRRAHRKLYQEHGRQPGTEKIALRSGVSTGDVDWILSLGQEPTSLDLPVGEDQDTKLGDLIAAPDAIDPHAAAEASALKDHIAEALAGLAPREQSILRMRFGLGGARENTLAEVGKVFGVTRERIRQIEAKALAKLRHSARTRNLKTFAED